MAFSCPSLPLSRNWSWNGALQPAGGEFLPHFSCLQAWHSINLEEVTLKVCDWSKGRGIYFCMREGEEVDQGIQHCGP